MIIADLQHGRNNATKVPSRALEAPANANEGYQPGQLDEEINLHHISQQRIIPNNHSNNIPIPIHAFT